jgi:hypothetical protein
VRQSSNVRPIKWASPSLALEVSPEKKNYRESETWFEFSNAVSICVVDIPANVEYDAGTPGLGKSL